MPTLRHDTLFLLLVAVVLGLLFRHGVAPPFRGRVALALGAWLAATALLALSGWYEDFTRPWRGLATVAAGLGGAAALVAFGPTRAAIVARPAALWIGLQAFRFPLELLLWLMYLDSVIGVEITLVGYNADILTGLTALPVALWVARRPASPTLARWAIAWNVAGLALLLNVLVIAILSMPVAFRVFDSGPANRMVAGFPFIWLAALLVPMGFFLHLASVVQLRARLK